MEVGEAVGDALTAAADQPTEVKAAIGAAAAAAIPAVTGPAVSTLWIILVSGLVLAVLASLAGIIAVILDGDAATEPDVLVTLFTTTVAGLIGLFVNTDFSELNRLVHRTEERKGVYRTL